MNDSKMQPAVADLSWPRATPLTPIVLCEAVNALPVWCKREDLVHPQASGNKWYKLLENVRHFKSGNYERLVSFGGGYSNHLHALALVGRSLGIATVGVVRGNYQGNLTPTLADCRDAGMALYFVDKQTWAERESEIFRHKLTLSYGRCFIVPEGGDNALGFAGCRKMAHSLEAAKELQGLKRVHVFVACGTGTTAAGLIAELDARFSVYGVSVLKGEDRLTAKIQARLTSEGVSPRCAWQVLTDWHGGGYAKLNEHLRDFIAEFERSQGFLLDPIYTAKVMYAVAQLQSQGHFLQKDTVGQEGVVVIHTGGLQGRRGFEAQLAQV